ncbi:hypothetical protein AX15_000126 [Amanita polypyramis BW_CC]|nr:hypothetical protein AX15_000126 [Amanita polypyramis BW_CC]
MPVDTMTVTLLPPTVNSLHPVQRSRLLKSARKLGDVLGAVPHLVDADSLPVRPSTAGSVGSKLGNLSHSAASSVTSLIASSHSDEHAVCIPISRSSLEARCDDPVPFLDLHQSKHKKQKSKQLARPLLLRLHMVPLPPTDAHPKVQSVIELTSSTVPLNGATSPSGPPPSFTDTINLVTKDVADMMPPSPLPEPDRDSIVPGDADKLRRRRMAKLTRTLGENIPTDLIFPQHHNPSEPTHSLGHSKAKEPKRRPQTSVPNISTDNSRPVPNAASQLAPPNSRTHRPRSLTVGSHSAAARAFRAFAMSSASHTKSPDEVPYSSVQGPVANADQKDQKDWSGEWSIKDTEKRAMALRNLKC